MHTFTVGTEKMAEWFLQSLTEGHRYGPQPFVKALEGSSILSEPTGPLLGTTARNAFYWGLTTAFSQHVPLRISPDAVWLTILNGLTQHIDENPEGLRHHFVEHAGKETLQVSVEGSRWAEQGVQLMSAALKERLGKRHDLIVSSFSTTADVDRVASEIMLMGAMKHYFEYRMMLCCGLTNVTILGEPADWENIKVRLGAMSEFDLKWWTDHLIPIVDQFKSACEGNPDVDFWKRLYVREGYGSGGQHGFTGWLTAFYPYLQAARGARERNPKVNWAAAGRVDADDLPSGLAFAPVTVVYPDGSEHPHKFYGGVVGCTFEEGAIRPISGWSAQEQPA